jgi:hypothetical protein
MPLSLLTIKNNRAAVLGVFAITLLAAGGIGIYLYTTSASTDLRRAGGSSEARQQQSATVDAVDAASAFTKAALLRAGLSPSDADAANKSLNAYVIATASKDFDGFAHIAEAHGGQVNPVLAEQARRIFLSMPERVRPEGWRLWNDEQVVKQMLYPKTMEVWKDIDWESAEVVTFDEAGALVDSIEYYTSGKLKPGVEARVIIAPFTLGDLELRVQRGEAKGAIVTLSVTNHEGKRQMVSILLGEYTPGKWFPISHKSVVYGG